MKVTSPTLSLIPFSAVGGLVVHFERVGHYMKSVKKFTPKAGDLSYRMLEWQLRFLPAPKSWKEEILEKAKKDHKDGDKKTPNRQFK